MRTQIGFDSVRKVNGEVMIEAEMIGQQGRLFLPDKLFIQPEADDLFFLYYTADGVKAYTDRVPGRKFQLFFRNDGNPIRISCLLIGTLLEKGREK